MIKTAKKMDKGAELIAEGKMISSENKKAKIANMGASAITSIMAYALYDKMFNNGKYTGRIEEGKLKTAAVIGAVGATALTAYSLKKKANSSNMREYQYGDPTAKGVGSQEYADVISRAKKSAVKVVKKSSEKTSKAENVSDTRKSIAKTLEDGFKNLSDSEFYNKLGVSKEFYKENKEDMIDYLTEQVSK